MIRYNIPRATRENPQFERMLDQNAPSANRYDCQGNPVNETNTVQSSYRDNRCAGPSACHGKEHQCHAGCTCRDAMLASACRGEPSLAMVYSPCQSFRNLFSPMEALQKGTLFRELDKPWKDGGRRC